MKLIREIVSWAFLLMLVVFAGLGSAGQQFDRLVIEIDKVLEAR